MKVFYHPSFTQVYTHDPAAMEGRMEAVVEAIADRVDFETPAPADRTQIAMAHTASHIEHVERRGLYDIAATAAGGAVAAARTGLTEPAFGLVRPPGHHASAGSAWGFCYFNNMAIALLVLKKERLIDTAMVLDIDLHFGDGTVNILGGEKWVRICNPDARDRQAYLEEVEAVLGKARVDLIGVSAGFDYHQDDWGGLLSTEDYRTIAEQVGRAARNNGGGCFGILEGGYNHQALGRNVAAFLEGLGVAR
jgi:acetoin utilization deacetylase AcuC-like enzyme